MIDWQTEIAARTLAQEARSEPLLGQQAVVWSMKHRVKDGRWGHNLASVCLWPKQFSGWASARDPNFSYACGTADNDPVLVKMRGIVQEVMASTEDPIDGAMWYYADYIAPPYWAEGATQTAHIGKHIFLKDVQ